MNELTLTDQMLVADALIEYGLHHVADEALFVRTVEVLRAIEYDTAADSIQRYRQSMQDLGGDDLVSRIDLYSRRA